MLRMDARGNSFIQTFKESRKYTVAVVNRSQSQIIELAGTWAQVCKKLRLQVGLLYQFSVRPGSALVRRVFRKSETRRLPKKRTQVNQEYPLEKKMEGLVAVHNTNNVQNMQEPTPNKFTVTFCCSSHWVKGFDTATTSKTPFTIPSVHTNSDASSFQYEILGEVNSHGHLLPNPFDVSKASAATEDVDAGVLPNTLSVEHTDTSSDCICLGSSEDYKEVMRNMLATRKDMTMNNTNIEIALPGGEQRRHAQVINECSALTSRNNYAVNDYDCQTCFTEVQAPTSMNKAFYDAFCRNT